MSAADAVSSILETLPQRPPTPPREAQNESRAPARLVLGPVDTRSNIHTPPGVQSPGGSITTNSTTRRSRKKVEFSAKAEYRDPPVLRDGEAKPQHPTPVSLPRSASKPVKSILKVTRHANLLGSSNTDGDDPSNPEINLSNMLDSAIVQLAGADRDSKVDAYVMLARACKASDNLPDRVALQEQLGILGQFIQRDITSRSPEGVVDISLGNHALNLLITLLGLPSIAVSLPSDFGTFVIDHCIRCFEDASVPKDTARHLMRIISLQNFPAKVMTPDRVGRLISSLHGITDHINGKSIIMSRVIIYRKLIKQCKQIMVIHSEWLPDLFTDMLSNLREIRYAAISLGLEAAFCIGHEKQFSRRVNEMFETPVSEEARYIELYQQQLQTRAKDRHDSETVPDIWSVVILLLRIPLNKWDGGKPWLEIMQTCFNNPNILTKINANTAWGRLMFLMQCEERGLARRLSTLTNPLISQLRRSRPGKMTEELRNTVLGGICTLFYYAFKPTTKSALLDTYWENGVKPIVTVLLDPKVDVHNDNIRQAGRMLAGLFDCRTPRRWSEDRIVDASLVKAEELPSIDSKWVRSNASKVFELVGPILEKDFFLVLSWDESPTYHMWQALVTAVASAGSKEIKTSKETALFMTEALSVLQKVWARGVDDKSSNPRPKDFLHATRAYLQIMVDSLGSLPFTEKPGKNQGSTKAPLYHLFSTLSSLPPGIADDDEFANFFDSVFSPFFDSKGDKAKMDLAQELLTMIPMESPRPYGPWLLVSSKISAWLGSGQSSVQSAASGIETPLGNDYREIVRVLERGFRSTPRLPWEHWESLFYTLFNRVRDEMGDAGFGLVAIEPLAKALLDVFAVRGPQASTETAIRCVTELLSVATQSRDRQAFEAVQRRLWGTSLASRRSSSFDVFDHLYAAVSESLGHLYDVYNPEDSAPAVRLLKELGGFFDRGNSQLFLKAMIGVQDGLLLWFRDAKRVLSPNSTALAIAMSLWNKVTVMLSDIEHPEQHLKALGRIFCASFDSAHRQIANSGVSLWNKLFENAQALDYPEQLKAALLRLQPHVDIALPGLEASSTDSICQQPMFIDSMEDFDLPRPPSTASSRRATPRPLSARDRSPELGSFDKPKEQARSTPVGKGSATNRRRSPPRLRHDDSQVQFAPINTSPDPQQAESQMLTERQKEVRERQKENAALFPEIRSSPGPKAKDGITARRSRNSSPDLPSRARARARARDVATPEPEPERAFDSYVSSTPTPRRGQPVLLPAENDMPDLPSSPPEPRRNPLAAEIRSRSASNSLLDEWQFSSSPVSGSPNPIRQMAESSQLEEVAVDDEDMLAEDEPELPASQDRKVGAEAGQLFSADEDMIEETILPEPELPKHPPVVPAPSTPRRTTRSMHLQETPKSDNDVYVDAPTSPLPPTPKRSERLAKPTMASRLREAENAFSQASSSAVSDADDPSSAHLVAEIDSRKVDTSEYRRPTQSPEKKSTLEVADCIVVGDSPAKQDTELVPRVTRGGSAISSTVGKEVAPESRKRKRRGPRAHESSSRKRRHRSPADEFDHSMAVPDSQPASAVKGTATTTTSWAKKDGRLNSAATGTTTALVDFPQEFPSSPLARAAPEARRQRISVDMVGVESPQADDHEVQSQIALEAEIQSSQERQKTEAVAATPAEAEGVVDPMDADAAPPAAESRAAREEVDAPAEPQALGQSREGQTEGASSPGCMQKLITMLRSSTELLLSAPSVSTEEAWEAEDALLEVTRALHEAKRRGRR